jgi:CHAT domain-containing protein
MRAFYTSARTASIGKALQDAQLLLMRDPKYSHPFYWAPYFVVGDSTKSMLSSPAPQPQPRQVATR